MGPFTVCWILLNQSFDILFLGLLHYATGSNIIKGLILSDGPIRQLDIPCFKHEHRATSHGHFENGTHDFKTEGHLLLL